MNEDEKLREILRGGEVIYNVQIPTQVCFVRKGDEVHLVAKLPGLPPSIAHTYSEGFTRSVSDCYDYLWMNLGNALRASAHQLLREVLVHTLCVEPRQRKRCARQLASDASKATHEASLQRQLNEIDRWERKDANEKPVLDDHMFRVNMVKDALAAIAEIRKKRQKDFRYSEPPPVTQKDVAYYLLKDRHNDEYSAAAQFNRRWKETGIPFRKMLKVNKTWDELTSDEKSALNCPEVGINERRKKNVWKRHKNS